ncbi:MAG TPA: DNA recombination protein RmuC [Thermoanaerobaculaceae bacterium]|nr:DNA recombination protein RmuC [Thermoanaerobaculaceae bacterium]
MSEWSVVAAALGVVVLALVAVQLFRSVRQERAIRDELGRVSLALAAAQRDTLAQVGRQVGEVVDRFHQRLGEFGQQVQGGQASTGEALRAGLEEARRTLQAQLEGLVGTVNTQLGASQKQLGVQFEGATKVFGELKGQLGQVAEMAGRMEALGREIEELQGILKAPKLRGNLGESQLEEFLRQVLPPSAWETQHRFAGGQAVDAVIKLRDHLVPVDAKFPLESFQRMAAAGDDAARKAARKEFERSVKGRIDEIADKYIRPGEGTFEFALMYIPAENVYYEVIIRDEALGEAGSLLAYATSRRVVPVSPNSFFAYLSTVATGLKGMQVEARAREILAELGRIQREFDRFAEAFRLIGSHLGNAQRKYEDADKLAVRLADRLQSVTGEERGAALEGAGRPGLPGEPAE